MALSIVTVQSSDLLLTKSVDVARPEVAQTVTYTVRVTNNGPNGASGVVVKDNLPAGVTFTGSVPSQGTYVDATGIWTVGTVPAGGNATLALTATVDGGTVGQTITNDASITAVDQADPNPGNDFASAGITVAPTVVPVGTADLNLIKFVDNETPAEGATIVYTVQVRNDGPDAATGIVVDDLLPSGTTFVSATASHGTYAQGTGVWTLGLAGQRRHRFAGGHRDRRRRRRRTPHHQHRAGDGRRPGLTRTPSDNFASATITVVSVDLLLTKVVSDAAPDEGVTSTLPSRSPTRAPTAPPASRSATCCRPG